MLFRGTIELLEPEEDNVTVFADEKGIPQSEFFAAGQLDIKPATMFIVRTGEYNGRRKVKRGDTTYSVYRTYPRPDGLTELYCEVRAGGN